MKARALALAVASSLSPSAARPQEPDELSRVVAAAVSHIRPWLRSGPVVLDTVDFDRAALAAVARELRLRLGDAPRQGCRRHENCSLGGGAGVLDVTGARVAGDVAEVSLTLYRDHALPSHSWISWTDVRVRLSRTPAGWRVTEAKVLRQS